MKKGFNMLRGAALLGLVVLFSSCNRGNGCPNNFKLTETIESVIGTLVGFIF